MKTPPCVVFEDDHLLVVNKPPGWNTHAAERYGGQGIYDWLRCREPHWANLAIMQRLDKETSGVMVFSKTTLANKSLVAQFEQRTVYKKYVLLTDRKPGELPRTITTQITRAGERYVSRPAANSAKPATTVFEPFQGSRIELPQSTPHMRLSSVLARPLTGRTHQIRVHAAESGFPILGDVLYGGTSAERVYLHCSELHLVHPAYGKPIAFHAPPEFSSPPAALLRSAVIHPKETDSYRVLHGASDRAPGWYVDKFGGYLLCESAAPLGDDVQDKVQILVGKFGADGVAYKQLNRQVRKASTRDASPRHISGAALPRTLTIRENGLLYEISFEAGYSVGLFLDQRENRRALLNGCTGPEFIIPETARTVLNTFAYTCGFSIAAAKAGRQTTSLDLSRNYLEWGKRNFELNHLDLAGHDFVYGDTFDWARRWARKGRTFDIILLDPPTFSQSEASGVFRAEKDYAKLVKAVVPLLSTGGVLFASTNAADWPASDFVQVVEQAVTTSSLSIVARQFIPQPPDFPVTRAEPAYLKTIWLRTEPRWSKTKPSSEP